jgi:hypothetical protein
MVGHDPKESTLSKQMTRLQIDHILVDRPVSMQPLYGKRTWNRICVFLQTPETFFIKHEGTNNRQGQEAAGPGTVILANH